jgi:RNA polymerase sigma-70 factor, ECF subfamily
MDSETLRRMIASAQAGDAGGYEALLQRYATRLYGYFLRATGRHHEAEDLLGELVLRLVRQLKKYDHRGRFEPWLFRIAANLVRDWRRRQRTRPQPASLDVAEAGGSAWVDRLASGGRAPDAALLAAEAAERLAAAMERLEEPTREVILLRHFGQLSFAEIAGLLDCPLGTVLARGHRGLASLREALRKNL